MPYPKLHAERDPDFVYVIFIRAAREKVWAMEAQSNFEPDGKIRDGVSKGWPAILSRLKSIAAGGQMLKCDAWQGGGPKSSR